MKTIEPKEMELYISLCKYCIMNKVQSNEGTVYEHFVPSRSFMKKPSMYQIDKFLGSNRLMLVISSIMEIYRKPNLSANDLSDSYVVESILNVIREIDFFGDKGSERMTFLLTALEYCVSTSTLRVA